MTDTPTDLFREIHAYLRKFIAYPSEHAAIAHALWIAHTHAMDAWESTPRIAFLSPEPGSGKTRALEITENLVPRPVEAVNVTPAYLFRKVADEDGRPTILFDEIDTVFGPRAKDNEEIRGLLNAGHRQGAVAGRCVVRGKQVETEEIPAYCAVALAGLDDLPDTIRTRSIIVRMRRRAPDEQVEPYRRRLHAHEGHELRDRLAAWVAGNGRTLRNALPEMPPEIVDRDADVWEPLFAIADLIGGSWPAQVRVSAVTLVTLAKAGTPSLGIRLLSDLRKVFEDHEQLTTTDILDALNCMDEAPWGDIRGKPLDARRLARRLAKYDVKPKTIRMYQGLGGSSKTAKGYSRDDLHDVWQRYLPNEPALGSPHYGSVTSVTNGTATNDDAGWIGESPAHTRTRLGVSQV
ncbi:DUF3631 domain-containing protein [Erythrobacter sp. GH1-10]|uniref:DUF3631 domain-containing protein n=1 Tax=Erythrobacter sp. GH1-10 TaxID=3349334 RepID=UPI003878001E